MQLIHDPKPPKSFNSGRWKKNYNPDLCFALERMSLNGKKIVCNPIPKLQHRPIGVEIKPIIIPTKMPVSHRFNFKKADWRNYALALDTALVATKLDPTSDNYIQFSDTIKEVSRKAIPRGCRKEYIPGLSEENMDLYKQYKVAFDKSPFLQITT